MTGPGIPAEAKHAARQAAATVLPDLQNDIRAAQLPLAHLLRTALQLAADEALDAAAPALQAEATTAERERIRQLATKHHALWFQQVDVPTTSTPLFHEARDFADLLEPGTNPTPTGDPT